VRFLTYSNQFDVEGLVATTSIHQRDKTAAWRIREIVEAYGKVRDNLEQHEPGFPTAEHLLSVLKEGLPAYGMQAVGEGKGLLRLRGAHRRGGPRRPASPLGDGWGGPNVLAQALWKVRATRTPEQLEKFVAKLRVYTISDQDDSGPWLRKSFPSSSTSSARVQRRRGLSPLHMERHQRRLVSRPVRRRGLQHVDNPWLDRISAARARSARSTLGSEYLMEGDTPSFLYLINNGLGDPEHPNWGGWGGRYELYTPPLQRWHLEPETRPIWSDAADEVFGRDGNWHTTNKATIWRWRSAYQNDFAARMDWTIKPYAEANHPPMPKLGHPDRLTAKPGRASEPQRRRLERSGRRRCVLRVVLLS
jgi:hypothetical protein